MFWRAGNVEAVRSWVASGADINVVDEKGNTPLMFASSCHRAECVAEMLRLGADARRDNKRMRTVDSVVCALSTTCSGFTLPPSGNALHRPLVQSTPHTVD
jgi:ankyrin repeat protein